MRERNPIKLQQENDRQKRQIDGLRRQDERQKREIEDLKRQLATARRAGFRQAAPFAKNRPQGRGRRPGRRAVRSTAGMRAAGARNELTRHWKRRCRRRVRTAAVWSR